MAALPDRFDLQVRRALEASARPDRQVDFVLGALMTLPAWIFWNSAEEGAPQPARVKLEGEWWVIVFDTSEKLRDVAGLADPLPAITVPVPAAADYALEFGDAGYAGLLVNPGDFAFTVTMAALRPFLQAWRAAGGRQGQGFWIPNMTTEEEDFWQEHGLE